MIRYLNKHDTDYVRDNLIFNYCLGDEQALLIESYVHNNQIDICFDPAHFFFFMTGKHRKFVSVVTPELFHFGVRNIQSVYEALQECLKQNGYVGNSFQIKEDNSKQIGVLFSPKRQVHCTPDELSQKMYDIYMNKAKSLLHVSTSFVGPYSGYEQIHYAFQDARALNDLLFFGLKDCVITRELRDKTARPCDITAILANVRRLTSTLCTGSRKEALRQMDFLIDDMVAPSYEMRNFGALWAAFEDVLGMFETVYPERVQINHRKNDDFHTLAQYKEWVHETIKALYAQLQGAKRYSPTLLMALSYINRNFTTDLSLTQLSETVYANPSTLSSAFNDEVGMSLSEYVTSLRIRRAQALLRSTDDTVAQIAQQAGFTSAKYFREIFKRQTGLSPQQYRDQ